ncbi:hypothetical protein PAPYR_9938 [Paratrimastix pyriformis]|uniref:Uncharacterized protein n=1 Tax=Paratrimastix pyriformis TaxID=342808 RepID=A0ABQ8UE94_9EUKA|nr:hypothetical protein PAPYR_9938 [Paratrimastix pyriformis]
MIRNSPPIFLHPQTNETSARHTTPEGSRHPMQPPQSRHTIQPPLESRGAQPTRKRGRKQPSQPPPTLLIPSLPVHHRPLRPFQRSSLLRTSIPSSYQSLSNPYDHASRPSLLINKANSIYPTVDPILFDHRLHPKAPYTYHFLSLHYLLQFYPHSTFFSFIRLLPVGRNWYSEFPLLGTAARVPKPMSPRAS